MFKNKHKRAKSFFKYKLLINLSEVALKQNTSIKTYYLESRVRIYYDQRQMEILL